jgi:hypothetical protein
MSADTDHEKCTQGRKKDRFAYPALSYSDFLGNMRNICDPRAENKTEAGVKKCRSKVFFMLKEKLN